MRELKFRQAIFHKGKFKFWHYWGYVGYRGEFEGPLTISGIRNDYEVKESQQYIDIKDKTDFRIYEGDIVKLPSGIVGIVQWNQEHCQFVGYYKNHKPSDGLIILYIQCEVIGNIYENPELL